MGKPGVDPEKPQDKVRGAYDYSYEGWHDCPLRDRRIWLSKGDGCADCEEYDEDDF